MEHVLPETHLELLQGIYIELVMAADPEATFIRPTEVSESEEES